MRINLPGLKQAMKDQFDKNTIIANNLANINTIGFKKDTIFFKVLDNQVDGANNVAQVTDFTQGHLEETANPLDVAISGRGFITVDTGEDLLFTREGHLKLDADGILRTTAGHAVMGRGGWISLNVDIHQPDDIVITEQGEILVGEESIDELLVTDFEDIAQLEKAGGNLFRAGDQAVSIDMTEPRVQQGFLERSNVNPAQEMIDLITIQRQFESVHKMVRTMDTIFNSAVNQIGKY